MKKAPPATKLFTEIKFHIFITAISVTSLFSGYAYGTPILDQSFSPSRNYQISFGGMGAVLWQSFTPGITGTLDGADVLLLKSAPSARSHNLIVSIRDSSFNNVLGIAQLTPQQVYGAIGDTVYSGFFPGWLGTFIHMDFALDHIQMVAGQSYYLTVNDGFNWMGSWSGGYVGGRSFSDVNADFGFRTYVTTVPEPGTEWLLGIGLLGLMGLAGRRPRN